MINEIIILVIVLLGMSTADKLENDSLLSDFRGRVKYISERVAEENRRTEVLTRENKETHEKYLETLQKQERLRRNMKDLRERIVNVSREDLMKRIETQKKINSHLEQVCFYSRI